MCLESGTFIALFLLVMPLNPSGALELKFEYSSE